MTLAGALSASALAGCSADKLKIIDPTSPTPAGAAADPIVALNQAAGGLIVLDRGQMAGNISQFGIFGRESFNYTPTEGRNTSGYLVTPEDPNAFGAGNFNGRFQTVKNVNAFLQIVEGAKSLTAAQASAARGFARTIEGLEFLHYITSRHNLGGPVVVPDDPTDIQPFVSRDSVYGYALARLNDAKGLLAQGGTAFPFQLTAGFSGFNTPTDFIKFNRAIAARLLAYRGSLATGGARTTFYQQALTAIGESFINPTGSLDLGVSHVYSTAAGDVSNGINATTNKDVVAHPSIVTDAQAGDARVAAKTTTIAVKNSPGGIGISTTVGFIRYPTQSTPIPIIRNAELILLRSEARYFTGDKAGALADLNIIRTGDGKLAALTLADINTDDQYITRLLYERRYTLLLEGHRWVDVRRFGKLDTLPLDKPTHVRALQQVIPLGECQARTRTGDNALFGPGCPT
jgi:starch-binding outer membrane protein, SusD/RagB family